MSIDTTKIIHGVVGGGRYTVTSPIVKEDYGLYLLIEGLELPATYEVDFSNSEHNGTSVTMIGNADGVLIPSQFISSGKDVFAFLYHVGADYGRTVYKFRIPNKLRPDRTDEEPTPEEQSTIDQAISALNTAVAKTAQDVIDADASAQSAKDDADRAEQAKTGAETAQGKAEEAQESAERAKDDAETSERNASESERKAKGYAETASEKADAITGLTATATTLPDGSSATASYNAETGVMSFGIPKGKDGTNGTDGNDGYSPTASVTKSGKVATITITDKNGTTNAQVSDGEDGATGATPNLTIGTVETLEPAESATATITGTPENPVLNLGIPQGEQGEVTLEDYYKAFVTDTAEGSIASFSDGADDIPLKSLVVDINPVQDLSNGDPSPENICPISGWTECNIQRDGKNLWNGTLINGDVDIDVKVGVTYAISATASSNAYLYLRRKPIGTSDYTRVRYVLAGATNGSITFVPEEGYIYSLWSNISYSFVKDVQIEVGSTATPYEPYQGQTIPINWQTEAGTVYGGTIDAVSGKLTISMKQTAEDLSQKNWVYYSSGNYFYVALADRFANSESGIGIWDRYKYFGNNRGSYLQDNMPDMNFGFTNASGSRYIYVKDSRFTNANDFKASLVGSQLVYTMSSDNWIEVQLSPTEVKSLLGQNNIFADTGDTSAEYRADTTLYISRLTEPDADMIADSNIVSGQYFMVGNSLYKATANIASGASVIVGTNAIRKSLSEALNEINS